MVPLEIAGEMRLLLVSSFGGNLLGCENAFTHEGENIPLLDALEHIARRDGRVLAEEPLNLRDRYTAYFRKRRDFEAGCPGQFRPIDYPRQFALHSIILLFFLLSLIFSNPPAAYEDGPGLSL
jgi:hypothetical protein